MKYLSRIVLILFLATVLVSCKPATAGTQKKLDIAKKQVVSQLDMQELMRASAAGRVQRVNAILDKGIDVDLTYQRDESPWSGKTALMVAAENGQSGVLEALVRRKANVNLKHYSDLTALMLAAGSGNTEAVKVLLAAGADPNAVGSYIHYGSFTPLMFAIRSRRENKLEAIDALVAGGADLNSKVAIRTPLMVAVENNDADMIAALLKRGADVNGRGGSEVTPLMWAAIAGTREAVQALLAAGAEVNLKDDQGKTALAYAEKNKSNAGNAEIVELLKRAGAKL